MNTITIQAPLSALDAFVSAWQRRQPVTVQTRDQTLESLAIVSISAPRGGGDVTVVLRRVAPTGVRKESR